MANNPSFSTGFRNALLGASNITTLFDNGELHIYSGTQPADADAAEGAGTVLGIVELPAANAFNAAASGAASKNGTWQDDGFGADAGGTAAWFRLYDSALTTGASTTAIRMDGEIGTTASDLNVASTTISVSDPLVVTAFTITVVLAP